MSFAVYLITDPAYDVVSITRAALDGVARGDVGLMVRDKGASAGDLAALARTLLPICRERGAPVFINGSCEVARAVGADGVHLPEAGLSVGEARAILEPTMRVGASRHAARSGADAEPDLLTLGPIRAMAGKAPPLGVEGFGAIAATYRGSVYALGGVDAGVAPELVRAGARGVAVIRAVYAARDPNAALANLIAAVRGART